MPGKEWITLKERSSNTEVLLVFVRAPRLGQVKTRLAEGVGPEKALAYYKKFVSLTLGTAVAWQRAAQGGQVREIWICYTPRQDADMIKHWLGREYRFLAQSGSGLGDRMASAMENALDTGADRVLLVGTDIPDMVVSHLTSACDALDSGDLVFGPSLDGGYWLVGAGAGYAGEIFNQIPWGTDQVLAQTLDRCRSLGRSWTLLPWLQDVDTAEDLDRTRAFGKGQAGV